MIFHTDLAELCALNGVSGREKTVRDYIKARLPKETEVTEDALGNLYVKKYGSAPDHDAVKPIMVCAHMDEVGLIITDATADGYLHFDEIGGIDPAVLIGRTVRLESGTIGVIGVKPLHLSKSEERSKIASFRELQIDIGAETKEEALKLAPRGSYASYVSDLVRFGEHRVKAKALDDRVGCALMLQLLTEEYPFDVTYVFTVQEEVGTFGAQAAAFNVRPEIGLILETTTAGDIAGVEGDKRACVLGEGPVVSYMDRRTLYDTELYRKTMALAEENAIPAQTKTVIAGGNDAGSVQRTAGGARVLAVSVPTRYLHSPVCVMDETDIENTYKLLVPLLPMLAGEAGYHAE